jgi:hypothetical protein
MDRLLLGCHSGDCIYGPGLLVVGLALWLKHICGSCHWKEAGAERRAEGATSLQTGMIAWERPRG